MNWIETEHTMTSYTVDNIKEGFINPVIAKNNDDPTNRILNDIEKK